MAICHACGRPLERFERLAYTPTGHDENTVLSREDELAGVGPRPTLEAGVLNPALYLAEVEKIQAAVPPEGDPRRA